MCGIAGSVSTGFVDSELVRRMCDTIVHRGPDGAGYHDDEHAALGMRRLAIIDVAGGQQPVYNEDRTVAVVFNGELYNFGELQAHLRARGHHLAGTGDSECLAHLYEEYGDELVHHLRGMFAFAIWDRPRGRLLLARDRLGKKPLYWRADGGSLSFASELKSLVQDPSMSRELDLVALHHYLTYQYVPAPWSIYQGVQKLPPGHLLVWQNGVADVRPYWRADFTPRAVGSEEELVEELRALLLDATKVRMVSERPLGAFLSGGIDSSAIVAAMAMQSTERVKTFSIGFEDSRFDEREYARMVARHYNTDHHELVVTPSAADLLPTLAWHFDEPFADSSAIPSFYVAQMSREHVTVVLTGDGGDEGFGGYRRYAFMATAGRVPVPAFARRTLERLGAGLAARSRARSPLERVGRGLNLLGQPAHRRYARLMSYFTPEQKHALYTDALRSQLAGIDSYQLLDDAFAASHADSTVGRVIDVDVNTYLPGDLMVKADISTMANSLEARSPLLDHKVIEWAAGLPTNLKVRGSETKYLLKRAVADWLPPGLLNRPKMGFGVPLASWLRTELRDLSRDVLTDATARGRGLFRPESVAALLDQHDAGIDHSTRIWALMQFELWHRMYVDGTPPTSRPTAVPVTTA
ncbi:asparagine synthase (glutamine-hydrolyzing) [Planosporangium flavigriseum]|uniref:asparagine synthase (glutamine-hydrolyzing) n=1 Tax=Planosporangium flavigriseum TaxID=373681 RepID=A0A8J3PMH6_9ACTN|nr:asparagine synthase (glutamine-hydrolyzing) [Planosporangium flavigriseum]NJC67509.1 asparagine synthase (glutamine-hydrolyzing) [Planosporangium flavigriseum]GIG75541.1 asparagine synthetase B [Planosporangium flavigriseum]